MDRTPDISVIVPVYNVEDYLSDCLDSLLRQGDASLEVIMIDDGSTDSSGAIAEGYAAAHPFLHACISLTEGSGTQGI